jgi:hypothetical protein
MTMAASDKNTRRTDEAERARHLAAGEAAAFATMLLGLLNGAEAAQHRSEHKPEPPATEPAPPPPHPTEAAPTELAPADHGSSHEDQHASAFDAPAANSPQTIHADAAATIQARDASATIDAAPAGEAPATHVLTPSPPVSSFSPPTDHSHSTGDSTGPSGTTAPSSGDLGASIDQLADTVTGLVDTSLATVSHTIASLSATVGQLTSSLSGTISHLADGLTGAVASLTHEAPVTGVLEPLVTDTLGSTPNATDFSGTTQHGASLLDSAGAIPTALLHPLPLQLGFLGQPTIDGHEPHDGAFSALGVHHF